MENWNCRTTCRPGHLMCSSVVEVTHISCKPLSQRSSKADNQVQHHGQNGQAPQTCAQYPCSVKRSTFVVILMFIQGTYVNLMSRNIAGRTNLKAPTDLQGGSANPHRT